MKYNKNIFHLLFKLVYVLQINKAINTLTGVKITCICIMKKLDMQILLEEICQ